LRPRKTLETVIVETPAFSATFFIVARMILEKPYSKAFKDYTHFCEVLNISFAIHSPFIASAP